MRKPKAPDWDEVWEWSNRVRAGEPLVLTRHVQSILRRAAREVAISDTETDRALGTVHRATLLLRKIRERIHTGSRRLTRALHQMYILRDAGDLEGARQQMRNVLEVEVIPFNWMIAQNQLDQLDYWKPPKDTAPARKTAPAGKAPARKKPAQKAAPARKAPARKKPAPAGKAPARKKPAPPGKAPARKKTAERRTGVTARAE